MDTLRGMFVCSDEYVRPADKTQLAPFDQASMKETFAAGSDRGSPERLLEWARRQPHAEFVAAKSGPHWMVYYQY